MKQYLAPVAGAGIIWAAFLTMPEVSAQGVQVPVYSGEIPPTVLAIPFIGDFLTKIQGWLPVIFQIVGAFAMVASITKNQVDDKVINYVLKAINILGFNFGAAKNDPDVQ